MMRRISSDNISAALLSLLFPGFGQLAQERNGLGFLQLAWASAAGAAWFLAVPLEFPRALAAVELLIVGSWSVLDALLWRAHDRQHGLS
jgi:hypothetical protein